VTGPQTEGCRRVQTGLNKGEARNALARAVFFNRLGELRDRSYDNQRHRASELNLLTAAITLWNTVYLEHTITTTEHPADDPLLDHLSPLGWEQINLTCDYMWNNPRQPKPGKLRPLPGPEALSVLFIPFRELTPGVEPDAGVPTGGSCGTKTGQRPLPRVRSWHA